MIRDFYNYFTTGYFARLMKTVRSKLEKAKKQGRPRVIPEDLEPVVVELYQQGYGYRAIACILRNEYSIDPHFSSIRKTLTRLGEVKIGGRLFEDLSISSRC